MISEHEQFAIFGVQFFRSYRLLEFIACHVLGDKEKTSIAIRNCWRTATNDHPHFANEGEFRSWLVRVLIDEALAIRCESEGESDVAVLDGVSVSDIEPGQK